MSDGKSVALEWSKSGENDWCATAPSGAMVVYAGPRFAMVEPAPSLSIDRKFSMEIDLSFAHRLTLARSGRAPGVLTRETMLDRVAKGSGYAHERQSGDPDFDRRVYAAVGDPRAAETLIADPEARAAILDLFDLGVQRIEARKGEIQATVGYAPSPALDGGQALSAIAARLDVLASLWPGARPIYLALPWQPWLPLLPWPIDRRFMALAWTLAWVVAIFWAGLQAPEHDARQIEDFARFDWAGFSALLGVMVLPAALIAWRRADAHRVLGAVLLITLGALPFSHALRVVEVNRLAATAERSLPADVVEVLDQDPSLPPGAVFRVADRFMQWQLSYDQVALARQGQLCATATTVEGLRGLRYVSDMTVWPCRPTTPATRLGPASDGDGAAEAQ